ncbi:hypothetical protein [Paeniglutamicibacter psychrophenolicus]|uniref:hypothetical protein n=1 Tax=Paeniglutamicibacter psychrophenolicus TaxID=257454 RepID=UPI00277FA4D4|nr:hypothetical protein [Paeniglutamicibacter psychrophenolicus]MDQ0093128.1 hypothetical protein [Paeniglutamicibacter psychrophenolicus]
MRIVEGDDVVMTEFSGKVHCANGEVIRMAIGEVFVMRGALIAERRTFVIELTENDYK